MMKHLHTQSSASFMCRFLLMLRSQLVTTRCLAVHHLRRKLWGCQSRRPRIIITLVSPPVTMETQRCGPSGFYMQQQQTATQIFSAAPEEWCEEEQLHRSATSSPQHSQKATKRNSPFNLETTDDKMSSRHGCQICFAAPHLLSKSEAAAQCRAERPHWSVALMAVPQATRVSRH